MKLFLFLSFVAHFVTNVVSHCDFQNIENAFQKVENALNDKDIIQLIPLIADAVHQVDVESSECPFIGALVNKLKYPVIRYTDEGLQIVVAGINMENNISSMINCIKSKDYNCVDSSLNSMINSIDQLIDCNQINTLIPNSPNACNDVKKVLDTLDDITLKAECIDFSKITKDYSIENIFLAIENCNILNNNIQTFTIGNCVVKSEADLESFVNGLKNNSSIDSSIGLFNQFIHNIQNDLLSCNIDLSKFTLTADLISVSDLSVITQNIITDFDAKNYKNLDYDIQKVLNIISNSFCKSDSESCFMLETLLRLSDDILTDMSDECRSDLIVGLQIIKTDLFGGLASILKTANDCKLTTMTNLITTALNKLNLVSKDQIDDINYIESILIDDVDVYEDIYNVIKAIEDKNTDAISYNLNNLVNVLNTLCNGKCQIVSNLILIVSNFLPNLKQCEADINTLKLDLLNSITVKSISADFVQLNTVLIDCNFEKEAQLILNIGQKLGFNTNTAGQILVSGINIMGHLSDLTNEIMNKQFSGIGQTLGNLINDLRINCDGIWCYVLDGIRSSFGIFNEDFTLCKTDFTNAEKLLVSAINTFKQHSSFSKSLGTSTVTSTSNRNKDELVKISRVLRGRNLSFWSDIKNKFQQIVKTAEDDIKTDWNKVVSEFRSLEEDKYIVDGFKLLAQSLDDVSIGIHDCHLDQIALIIEKLVTSLALPQVGWISTAFNIVINGGQIYDDVYNGIIDFENKNYIGFGYELAQVAVIIVKN